MFSEKKKYFTLKRQPIVSKTDSFFIILFYSKKFIFSFKYKIKFQEQIWLFIK